MNLCLVMGSSEYLQEKIYPLMTLTHSDRFVFNVGALPA